MSNAITLMLLRVFVANYRFLNYYPPRLLLQVFFSSQAIVNLNNCEVLEEAVKINVIPKKKVIFPSSRKFSLKEKTLSL